ncbi:MAG: hypothetical protein A2104_06770 [Candidatus Melainabacteria bacterium GWF2_32_7]|nr:MAG: hypothetical protein A2104_06770 [Candidatus Melainabacteria bacterium GWF2_32_7]
MRNRTKLVAASILTGAFVINCLTPVLAQGYQSNYNYGSNYNQGYNQGYSQVNTPTYQPAYQQQNYQSNYVPPLQGRIVLPRGAELNAAISSPISSEYARTGDTVTAMLNADISSGGSVILPAGTRVEGRVVDAEKAGRMGKNGKLNIRFNTATTPNGKRYPISGKIATEDGTGIVYGGTSVTTLTRAAKNTAIGAAGGAIAGVALGGITGKPGTGAWSGTAIGSGAGLLSTFATRGIEAVIPGNTRIDIVLDQDLEDTGNSYHY